jgi:peptide/nickel transport system permease protein
MHMDTQTPQMTRKKRSGVMEVWHRLKRSPMAVIGLNIDRHSVPYGDLRPRITPYTYSKQNLMHAFESALGAVHLRDGRNSEGTSSAGSSTERGYPFRSASSPWEYRCSSAVSRGAGGLLRRQNRQHHHANHGRPALHPVDPARDRDRRVARARALQPHDRGWHFRDTELRANRPRVRPFDSRAGIRRSGEGRRFIGLRIISQHIIPNCTAPIIVQATLGVATAILTAAGLSFIGLGIQPPIPEWGAMLSGAEATFAIIPT